MKRRAGLRQAAVVEDVDLKAARQLDKPLCAKPAAGDWIDRRQNLIIIGETGLGKSWLACALGHKACRIDRADLYQRVPRMFDALALARGDGRHTRLLEVIARTELLILDDWGLASLTPDQGRDMLEIVDDRHDVAAPSSPANWRSNTGMTPLPTRPLPTPFWTASCTTHTESI